MKKCFWLASALLAFLLNGARLSAAPPPGYYDAASGKDGGDLKAALHQIIRGHTIIPYGSLLGPLRELWRDPADPTKVRLTFSGTSVDAFSGWNREHLWPRARGNSGASGADDSDLFHVVPTDVFVNAQRGHLYFDVSNPGDPGYRIPAHPSAPQTSRDSDSWQPAPAERGDIARAIFYMDVRYNGTDPETSDMELVSIPPTGAQMGHLNTLLLWHAEDPPDDDERRRNDLIHSNYQGNRNPFIDHPEFAAAIWGSGVPGDPLGKPLARIEVLAASATETTGVRGRLRVSLNQFALAEGVSIPFQLGGAASTDEVVLSGADVSYDPLTGLGSVLIPAGQSAALVDLLAVNDGVAEGAEAAIVSLLAGPGHEVTPDASAAATITLRDNPSMPVAWTFNAGAPFGNPLPSNVGDGSLSFSNWLGTLNSFTGVSNTLALALVGSGGNGSSVDFVFPMTGQRDLVLNFWTRGTSSGFNSGFWSVSTNGVDFATNSTTNTATRSVDFVRRTVDFSAFPQINNAPRVVVRYTLAGATTTGGNNRIDELNFTASTFAVGDGPREVTLAAVQSSGREQGPVPGIVAVRLNGPAPAAGLEVALAITGTAIWAQDYTLEGLSAHDPVAGNARVTFAADQESALIRIVPVSDAVPDAGETVVFTVPGSGPGYLPGLSTTAVVTIGDLPNDDFALALPLSGSPVVASGTTVGATREADEPWHLGGSLNNGGRSVWWNWVAPWTGSAVFTTAGSEFDTVLAVYTGNALASLTRLAYDDDAGPGATSRIVLPVTQGSSYLLAVDGYGSTAAGSVSLSVSRFVSLGVFLPGAGSPGRRVELNGGGLTGATEVRLGGLITPFEVLGDTRIAVTIPAGATTSTFSVFTPEGTATSAASFVVTTPAPGYDAWTSTRLLDPATTGAVMADPDADGVPNLLEYAFGREPMAVGEEPVVRVETRLLVDPADGVEKLFAVAICRPPRTDDAGLLFRVEDAGTLDATDWSASVPLPAEEGAMVHRASVPLGEGGRFFRARVIRP